MLISTMKSQYILISINYQDKSHDFLVRFSVMTGTPAHIIDEGAALVCALKVKKEK